MSPPTVLRCPPSALARRYRYDILRSEWADPLLRHVSWHVPGELDLAAMRIGADAILGEHDFSAFCRQVKGETGPIIRRVMRTGWSRSVGDERIWIFSIEANAFCHQMVRSLLGRSWFGQGRIQAGDGLDPARSPALARRAARPRPGAVPLGRELPKEPCAGRTWEPGQGDWQCH